MKKLKITISEKNGALVKAHGMDKIDFLAAACLLVRCVKEKTGMSYEKALDAIYDTIKKTDHGESSVKNPNEV